MRFLLPQLLWLLLVVPPIAVAVIYRAWRTQKRFVEEYGEWRLIKRHSKPIATIRFVVKAIASALALACLIVALARPSLQDATLEYPVGTVDVVAIVDVSRSMAVPDYAGKIPGNKYQDGTRLDMARYLLTTDIVGSLGYNQLGVVAFSGTAFPKAFLTDDLPSLKWQLDRSLTIGSVPGDGSQLATAMNMASALFDLDSPPGHRRVLVLFSDGGNDSDDAKLRDAMRELKKRNVDLIIAGLGSKDAKPIPVRLLSPSDQYQYNNSEWFWADGQIARSALDEDMLIAIKNAIGGRYVRVDTASDFHIGNLVSGTDVKHVKGERELFIYPLWASLFFLVVAFVAPREFSMPRRKKKLPAKRK